MARSWKSQIADDVRATSMMKPKWPDDAMAHIASLQADNDRLRQLLSEAEKREREARAKAVEDVLSALTAHELYQYRPKAFQGFIDYARSALQSEER